MELRLGRCIGMNLLIGVLEYVHFAFSCFLFPFWVVNLRVWVAGALGRVCGGEFHAEVLEGAPAAG